MHGASPQTALRALLEEALTESELRRLLFDAFGREVLTALPSGTPAEVFFAAVDVLERKGLVDDELFTRLVGYAPGKQAAIAAVAAAWGIDATSPDPPGEPEGAAVGALEALQGLLQADDPRSALALVCRHQGLLFPASGSMDVGGRVEQRLTLWAEPLVLVVETTRTWRMASGSVASAYYFLIGRGTPLLRARAPAGGRVGWTLASECGAALDRCLELYRSRRPPFEYHGDCHVFVGNRAELSDNDRLAAWTAAKDAYARVGFHVRTVDGLLQQIASRALGERWYSRVSRHSPLLRPR